jgi:hypothetical protein
MHLCASNEFLVVVIGTVSLDRGHDSSAKEIRESIYAQMDEKRARIDGGM